MISLPFAGQHILVVGFAREGAVAARWLAEHGAAVVISDLQPRAALADRLAELAHLPVLLHSGAQTPDLLTDIQAVVASPGVPQDAPLFLAARAAGIPVVSETRLFALQCPAPITGITGSSGKTTTTTLTARMLAAAGRHVWLGGNIGDPLLGQVARIQPDDRVVMELSSFQLLYWAGSRGAVARPSLPWRDDRGLSPHVAALLNLTPNHLDRHPSMAHYAAAKAHILAYQGSDDVAILNREDAITHTWAATGRVEIAAGPGQEAVAFPLAGRVLTFGCTGRPPGEGAWVEDGKLWLHWQGRTTAFLALDDLRLRGRHNLANTLAAACLAAAAGAEPAAMTAAIREFTGVAHRLEIVREVGGVLWINDSIATSPERAIAAIKSFDQPILLLAGGRDKHLPWEEWAAWVHERVRCVITFGEAAPLIANVLRSAPAHSRLEAIEAGSDLAGAVAIAQRQARPGDVVLLSPGGTSFDHYVDFAARGQHFRTLVHALPSPHSTEEPI